MDAAEEGIKDIIRNTKTKVKNFQVASKNFSAAKKEAKNLAKMIFEQCDEIAESPKFKESLKGYPIGCNYGDFKQGEKVAGGKVTYYAVLLDYGDMESEQYEDLNKSEIAKFVSECEKECSKLYEKENTKISTYAEDESELLSLKTTEGLKIDISFSTSAETEPRPEN